MKSHPTSGRLVVISMSPFVFLVVLTSAFLHAAWNAWVKGGTDKRVSLGSVMIGQLPLATLAILVSPVPHLDSLPYLGAGLLLHFGYHIFLLKSYQAGDLTQVYPIARGSTPLIVALFSLGVLDIDFTPGQLSAMALISFGILSMGLIRQVDGTRNSTVIILALGTGLLISSYSIVDGLGARLAGTAFGFFGWLSVGNAIVLLIYFRATAPEILPVLVGKGLRKMLIGGSASFAGYALIIWSFTQAPIALVTALRETSVVFALFFGAMFLRERLGLAKVLSTLSIVSGAAMLLYLKR